MNLVRAEIVINSNLQKVWNLFIEPKHITNWNSADDNWVCAYAKNDLKVKGRFVYRMTKKDKSASFNISGTYKEIQPLGFISYTLDDKRKVGVTFEKILFNQTRVIVMFQPEWKTPVDAQQFNWQVILNNFKKYVETTETKETYDSKTDKWVG